ncbi:MAG: flagellar motor protein MotB [Pseudomonadota bacterium]
MKKEKRVCEDKPVSWQTTYCSFIILLVSFFVMLCSYAQYKRGRFLEIQKSFREAVSDIPAGLTFFNKGEGISAPAPEVSSNLHGRIAAPIQNFLKGKGLEDKVFLKSKRAFVCLTLLDDVLFRKATTDLSSEAKDILKDFALTLGNFSQPIKIEGHTDDQPVQSGTRWSLSAMKAISVMKYLRDECGISQERLSATGFSAYRPFVPNNTDEERLRNRRVDIIIPVVKEFFNSRGGINKEAPPSFKIWDLSG